MDMQGKSGQAFGGPGQDPHWTSSSKDGVGTARGSGSRVWFTLARGIVTEIYYPSIDSPQTRELEFLVSDGETFCHEETRDLRGDLELMDATAPGYRRIEVAPDDRYRLVKEVIAHPELPCVLVRVKLEANPEDLANLRMYVLLGPHLGDKGRENSGHRARLAGRELLLAWKGSLYLALGATVDFVRTSCGYVGVNDGYTDLRENFRMDYMFERAEKGNIALTGELDLSRTREFTVGVAFGESEATAAAILVQALTMPWPQNRREFMEAWAKAHADVQSLDQVSSDGGKLFRTSHTALLVHEDKRCPGASVASLSIPWGEIQGDRDVGGYHLVWPRDLVHSASALLALGDFIAPYRALVYLACTQQEDGGFAQAYWITGTPQMMGRQLDEVASPVLLAWQVWKSDALREFDPYPMVRRAAGYLVTHAPLTQEERWEHNSGYSPATLAIAITALACAAEFARDRGDGAVADFLLDYADFLESHVEAWTVTTQGSLVPDIRRHYIWILPVSGDETSPNEDPDTREVKLPNQRPGGREVYPARAIISPGFLEFVRYGIRRAGTDLMEESLRVVDAVLKVDTPFGPCWRRYNHDGYGERPDGSPYQGWGVGRAWPLLTGERGHYELAAGRDVRPYIRAMEQFASGTGLLPEQIWDGPDLPEKGLHFGRPSGSARPLMWSHAEYIKLLRSVKDGQVFDRVAPVADRYLNHRGRKDLEVWKTNRQIRSVARGQTLRIQTPYDFRLRRPGPEGGGDLETAARDSGIGIYYADVSVSGVPRDVLEFTFVHTGDRTWEGRYFSVRIVAEHERQEPDAAVLIPSR